MRAFHSQSDPTPESVVITGIGLIASVGSNREAVWNAVRQGSTGIKKVTPGKGVPPWLSVAATVDDPVHERELKSVELARHAASEAIRDARVDFRDVDRDRFACAISAHMADTRWIANRHGLVSSRGVQNWDRFLPNAGCSAIANQFGLFGPRLCHSTACASGIIDFITAVRNIQDGHADMALAGSGEGIDSLFAAGFKKMRVLSEADDPSQACLPFDRNRNGFVMGEGAAMLVVERLSHALARNATIYAEVVSTRMLADAHHMTSLDIESESLTRLIRDALHAGSIVPSDIEYINAHGTGTRQNDVMETKGIRRALRGHADHVGVSSLKPILGHLINASGSVELALTTLALRDGFIPPTMNLYDPDPACDLDYLPLQGRRQQIQHALKLTLAFGGHLVAVALRRWNSTTSGFAYPAATRIAA